jgi:DNA invertase Pin-like site-specific DNA recombinase
MKVGYIRVSKQEQNEALQRDALKEAGCEKYFRACFGKKAGAHIAHRTPGIAQRHTRC